MNEELQVTKQPEERATFMRSEPIGAERTHVVRVHRTHSASIGPRYRTTTATRESGSEPVEYRRLGNSGLRLSVLGLGTWLSFDRGTDLGFAVELMSTARRAGCNFFDSAESYAGGESETLLGEALRVLGWPRQSYVVSTKLYWGLDEADPNMNRTLNRKYIMHSINGSLARLGLDFVDLLYCHRPDPATPIEEIVWAMHDLISSGRVLYWGTSEWPAAAIWDAIAFAEKYHLRAPVTEQTEYNLLRRVRVESEYEDLWRDARFGNTVYSPLASGLLSGKYHHGIPQGSRAQRPDCEWLAEEATDPTITRSIRALSEIAENVGCSPAQMSIAWCTLHPMVSSVILGVSSLDQLEENLDALRWLPLLSGDICRELRSLV